MSSEWVLSTPPKPDTFIKTLAPEARCCVLSPHVMGDYPTLPRCCRETSSKRPQCGLSDVRWLASCNQKAGPNTLDAGHKLILSLHVTQVYPEGRGRLWWLSRPVGFFLISRELIGSSDA